MKKLITIAVIAAILLGLLVITGPFYIVQEGYQALVVRFGQIKSVATDAGLKLRTPFIDNVVIYPKKVLPWDGEAQRIPTKENQFIWVDATARWRISDPIKFYESVSTMEGAYGKLDDVIDYVEVDRLAIPWPPQEVLGHLSETGAKLWHMFRFYHRLQAEQPVRSSTFMVNQLFVS